jgi:hypothetical protein
VGHKGIRDGGPQREPDFRPEEVVGLTTSQAMIRLAHEGFQAEPATADEAPTTLSYHSNRVRITVHDDRVTEVTRG